MTSPSESVAVGAAHCREVEAALEMMNLAGQEVETRRLPEFVDRDWEGEAQVDHFVGGYCRNIAEHYHGILSAPDIGRIVGLFGKDVPAAIVGAGPSLDKNAEALRAFPGLVVACDRAAKALVARGIRPDLVVSVDPHLEVVARMLDYPESEGQVLALSVCADPDISKRWRGIILYMSHQHPGTQFFDRVLPALFPGMPGTHVLGNVGNMALQLAAMVGCSPLVLVGQDYAYTGGRMHADEWCRNGSSWERMETDHAAKLERRSGKVDAEGERTYLPFLSYRRSLSMLAREWKLDVVNATEGGIIVDFPRERLADVCARLSKDGSPDPARARFQQAAKGGRI